MLLIIHTFFITVTLTALVSAIPVFKNEMASKYQPSSVSFPRAVKADDAHQMKALIRPGIVPGKIWINNLANFYSEKY